MELRAWQVEALETLQLYDYNGVIKVASGQGKTVLAIALIEKLLDPQGKALVVVPTINLMEQWVAQIKRFAPVLSVSRFYGGEKNRSGSVIVGVVNSVVESSWRDEHLVIKVLDEVHHYGASTHQRVFGIVSSHTIGLSATPERDDEGDLAIRYGAGKVVYALGNLKELQERFSLCAIRVPFTAPEYGKYRDLQSEITRMLMSSGIDVSKVTFLGRKGNPYALRVLKLWGEQAQLRHNAHNKIDVIRRILHAEQGKKVIIFSEGIAFSEKVGLELGALVVHSSLSKKEVMSRLLEFRKKSSAVLVAPRMIDEGYDVPDANVAIIASFTRSGRQMIQRDGRILRTPEFVRRYTLVLEGIEEDKYYSIIKRTSMDEFARAGLWLRYSKGFVDDREALEHFEQYTQQEFSYDDWLEKKLDLAQQVGSFEADFYEQHADAVERLLVQHPDRWPLFQRRPAGQKMQLKTSFSDQEQRRLKEEVRRLHQRVLLPEEFFSVLMRSIEGEVFEIDEETARYVKEVARGKLEMDEVLLRLVKRLARHL